MHQVDCPSGAVAHVSRPVLGSNGGHFDHARTGRVAIWRAWATTTHEVAVGQVVGNVQRERLHGCADAHERERWGVELAHGARLKEPAEVGTRGKCGVGGLGVFAQEPERHGGDALGGQAETDGALGTGELEQHAVQVSIHGYGGFTRADGGIDSADACRNGLRETASLEQRPPLRCRASSAGASKLDLALEHAVDAHGELGVRALVRDDQRAIHKFRADEPGREATAKDGIERGGRNRIGAAYGLFFDQQQHFLHRQWHGSVLSSVVLGGWRGRWCALAGDGVSGVVATDASEFIGGEWVVCCFGHGRVCARPVFCGACSHRASFSGG